MTRSELIISALERQYGDMVPMEAVKSYFTNPTRMEYLHTYYVYDPVMRRVVNRQTGKMPEGNNLSMGAGLSPMSVSRAEWILRMGYEPWRVGTDEGGRLWAKEGADGEKIYAA